MSKRFIDDFSVILLDQGRTFMFEHDRFGDDVDYFKTYESLGGCQLKRLALNALVGRIFDYMLSVARNPERYGSFPSVSESIEEMGEACVETDRIEEIFAIHEVGVVTDEHISGLRSLSKTHRLGIVSNIWARKEIFERNLRERGVIDCFEHRIWSSAIEAIKPDGEIFRRAFDLFEIEPKDVLFVGDHPMRDVDAAKKWGCSTVWVRNEDVSFPDGLLKPDLVVENIADLLEL